MTSIVEEPEPTEQFEDDSDSSIAEISPQFDESEQSAGDKVIFSDNDKLTVEDFIWSDENTVTVDVGKMYFKGEIALQDLDKAEKYLLLSEDNEFTQYALGKLYLQKEKYDIQKAVDCFEKSADKNIWSSYQLGRLYLFGAEGFEKDKEKAVEWFTKSANNGNEYAQNMLDNMERFEDVLLANTVFGLFANLSRCIEDDYTQKYKSVRRIVDSRLRRMIRQKQQALGIKDEPSQSYEQSY